ncbi:hypothetical protein ACLB2K_061157 [Fragaria x ananassa]
MEELKKLVKEGKIKYIGLSEASPETMKAHAVHPVSAVQMEWSLWTRDIEEQIVPLLQRRTPRFQGDNLEKNKDIYAKTQNLAEKHGCSPAQLALAWVLSQGDGVIPIPGTTEIKNLEDNIASLGVILTEEDMKEISNMIPTSAVAGNNAPDVFISCSWRFANTPAAKDSKISS